MIKAYFNYPDPHVTAHFDPDCGNIQSQHKLNQRYRWINLETILEELLSFRDKKYMFAATPEHNDMWLEIDFHDQEFELAVLGYICRLLGMYYSPFEGMKPRIHC